MVRNLIANHLLLLLLFVDVVVVVVAAATAATAETSPTLLRIRKGDCHSRTFGERYIIRN